MSNRADDFGTMRRDPPEHEEGALRAMAFERLEELIDAATKPTRARDPFLARDGRLQRFYLKVFLDVDREEVRCRI